MIKNIRIGKLVIRSKQNIFFSSLLFDNAPQFFLKHHDGKPYPVTSFSESDLRDKKIDCYFTPNTFEDSRREENIISFNSFFADFDAGRDKDHKYRDISAVSKYKTKILEKLSKIIPYSALIETRNGYHAYWFIAPNFRETITLTRWKEIAKRIVADTKSDPTTKDGSHLLRVPLSYAVKGGDYESFRARVIEVNEIYYDPEELMNAFPAVPEIINSKITSQAHISSLIKTESKNEAVEAIKRLDYNYFVERLNVIVSAGVDFSEWVKININMRQFLGLPPAGDFCCIIHDDKHPSSTIFAPNEKYNYWRYRCRSSNCNKNDKALTIIDLVMDIANVEAAEAIRFLKQCLNIPVSVLLIIDDGKTLDDTIRENKIILKEIMDLGKSYKDKVAPLQNIFNTLSKIAFTTAKETDTMNLSFIYFLTSKRHLIDITGESKAYQKVQLMVALAMIEKADFANLPESIKQRDIKFITKNKKQFGRNIQYYRYIPIDKNYLIKCLDTWITAKGSFNKINAKYLARIFN